MTKEKKDDQGRQRPVALDEGSSGAADGAVPLSEPTTGDPQDRSTAEPKVPAVLPVLPIRDTVAFPGTVMPLTISREKSKRVLDLALAGSRMIAMVAQRQAATEDPHLNDLYRVGTAGVLLKLFRVDDGTQTIVVHGLARVGLESLTQETPYLEARVNPRYDDTELTTETEALVHSVRRAAQQIIEMSPDVPQDARVVLDNIRTPGGLADFVAANLSLGLVLKQELLETFDVTLRLRKVYATIAGQVEILELSQKLQSDVRAKMGQSQREYFLREQLKAIQHELGQADARTAALDKLEKKIVAARMPEAVEAEARRELERMSGIPQVSPEYSVAQDYVAVVSSPSAKSPSP